MLALGRWAPVRQATEPDRSLRSGWLAVACKASRGQGGAGVHATCEFRLEDGTFHARIADVSRPPTAAPPIPTRLGRPASR
jgi:hypothetical protein